MPNLLTHRAKSTCPVNVIQDDADNVTDSEFGTWRRRCFSDGQKPDFQKGYLTTFAGDGFLHGFAHVGGALGDDYSDGFEGFHFFGGRSGSA
jgi:hypothetical protein